jgi:Sigma-70 region 2
MTRNSSDAEDLVQDQLIRAFTGFSGYQHGNLHAWLMTIMTNTAINTHRSRQRRPTEVLTAHLPESPTMRHGASSHWRSPEKCLLESVPSDRTLTALRQLPMPARWCCTTQTWKACATARSPASSVYRSGRSCHASIAHASAFATYSPPQDSPHPPTCHATQRAWPDATPTREICFGDLRRTHVVSGGSYDYIVVGGGTAGSVLADNVLLAISPGLWVVGVEKHRELNAVGVLKCQYRTVFALGDR